MRTLLVFCSFRLLERRRRRQEKKRKYIANDQLGWLLQSSCRKLSGGPFQAFADVTSNSLTFFDTKEDRRYEGVPKENMGGGGIITTLHFSKVSDRAFCSSCYTPLWMRYEHKAGVVALALGAIDEGSMTNEARDAFRLSAHIFVSQKAWWCDVERDGVPLYDRFSKDFGAKL